MKKLFVLFFTLVFAHINLNAQKNTLDKVYDNISNRSLEKRLVAFAKQGLEREVKTNGKDAEHFVKTAKSYLGTPYKFGGTSRNGIDCSGTVYACMRELGIEVPHSSQELARYGKVIDEQGKLQPGDIVFFAQTYKTSNVVTHSGIYIGDGKFVHASTRDGVTINKLEDNYYKQKYLFATRIF